MQERAPGGLVFWSGQVQLQTRPSFFNMPAVKSLVVSHERGFAVRRQFCKQLSSPDHSVVRGL